MHMFNCGRNRIKNSYKEYTVAGRFKLEHLDMGDCTDGLLSAESLETLFQTDLIIGIRQSDILHSVL